MNRIPIIVCWLAIAIAGCDLLSTRTPQPPAQQSSFTTPTTPDIVLQNFQAAINNRDVVSYGECFSDSTRSYPYHFVPAADAQQYASTFLTWNVTDETIYLKNLIVHTPASNTLDVILDSLVTILSASDSSVYTSDYTLNVQQTDQTKPTLARGNMRLTIKTDPITHLWAITQWIDIANGVDPSWSVMKARFTQ